MLPDARRGRENRTVVGRRRLLAAVGSTAVAGLAGCRGFLSKSFESSPVVLPSSSQDVLRLKETDDNSSTTSLETDGGGDVDITSHTAVYSRAAGIGGE